MNTKAQSKERAIKLVRSESEIKQLTRTLAARFGYFALATTGNNDTASSRSAASYFGSTNN